MQTSYKVQGMHCDGCASKIKSALRDISSIQSVTIDVPTHIATITSNEFLKEAILNEILKQHKLTYRLEQLNPSQIEVAFNQIFIHIKPYLLQTIILLIIFMISFIPYFQGIRHIHIAMNLFMGLFFLIFAAFKFYNLQGFATSFAQYDLIAKRSRKYALFYPFLELVLGVFYLLNIFPRAINITTLIIMSVGSWGVYNALKNKRKIQCACLGTKFNLPLSYLTLFENMLMAVMAIYSLLIL